MGERIFAICVAAVFGFLPYAIKGMPTFVAWIGIAGAMIIGGLTFAPINPRLVMPAGFMIASFIGFVAASSWMYQRYAESPRTLPDAIARLAELGWTVKPGQDEILFEIAGSSLPPMQESSILLSQISKPFRLHFQSVPGLDGLHYLADIANCRTIEINVGEFTDISELHDFKHLTKLVISQVPLNGVGTVDAAPLSSLDITPLRGSPSLSKISFADIPVVDVSPLLDLPRLSELSILRVPARADVLKELERRGVKIRAN